jgi:hypothetical protein
MALLKTNGIMERWGKHITSNIARKENVNPTFHHSILPPFHIEVSRRVLCLVS